MISHTSITPVLPALLNSIEEGILVVNSDNKITLYNPQFTKMWGIPTKLLDERNDEKTLNYVFEQLLDPLSFIQKVKDLYNSDIEDSDIIHFKDGKIFERHSMPFKTDTKNNKSSRLWSFRDVTEKVNSEHEIKVYKNHLEKLVEVRTKNLEDANSRLESFNYSASHDLRAPLRSIEGFSTMLLEDFQSKLGSEGKAYIKTIHASVKHMRSLIDNLLSLSQVTHNKLVCQKVDLGNIANNVLTRLQSDMPDRKLNIDISPTLHTYADSELMNIALENLIGNALKYSSKREKPFIKLDSYIDNGETIFFIKDNGVGFNMNVAKDLFKPFRRLHSDKEFDGNGVGLATVQRIILQHNGKIWAEAQPNQGATFYFTLSVKNRRYVTH